MNQQLTPADGQYGGVLWAKLGTFTVTNGKITIAMNATGANGDIVADGILLTAESVSDDRDRHGRDGMAVARRRR